MDEDQDQQNDPLTALMARVMHGGQPTQREAESLVLEINRQRRIVNSVIEAIGDNSLVDGRLVKRILKDAS